MPDPISHVNVWPAGDDLLVTWRGGGDVSVFVSDDPVDAGVDVRGPDAPGRATVPRGTRAYVHLFDPNNGFTVAAERLIEMDGVHNLRDIGGYPTADGNQTQWGRAFRSGRLDEATDADLERIAGLGITTVFDLRTDEEVERQPDRLPAGLEYIRLPMSSNVAVQKGLVDRIIDGDVSSFTKDDMAEGYLRMLGAFGEFQAQMIRAVAQGERVLFHCAAGKDRTGITAMNLLGLAEVADGHILDDYELSAQHQPYGAVAWFTEQIVAAGIDPGPFDLEAMMGSPRPVMRMAIDGARERWGSARRYAEAVGVTADEVDSVVRHLVFEVR